MTTPDAVYPIPGGGRDDDSKPGATGGDTQKAAGTPQTVPAAVDAVQTLTGLINALDHPTPTPPARTWTDRDDAPPAFNNGPDAPAPAVSKHLGPAFKKADPVPGQAGHTPAETAHGGQPQPSAPRTLGMKDFIEKPRPMRNQKQFGHRALLRDPNARIDLGGK